MIIGWSLACWRHSNFLQYFLISPPRKHRSSGLWFSCWSPKMLQFPTTTNDYVDHHSTSKFKTSTNNNQLAEKQIGTKRSNQTHSFSFFHKTLLLDNFFFCDTLTQHKSVKIFYSFKIMIRIKITAIHTTLDFIPSHSWFEIVSMFSPSVACVTSNFLFFNSVIYVSNSSTFAMQTQTPWSVLLQSFSSFTIDTLLLLDFAMNLFVTVVVNMVLPKITGWCWARGQVWHATW